MKKRALIFSTAYLPLVGGAEIALKETTDRLTEWEFDLVCAKIAPELPRTERIGNVRVFRVGVGHPIDKYLLSVLGPLHAIFLRRVARHDLVWSLMASYGGFASLVYSLVFPRTPYLLTLQEGDPTEHYAERTGKLSFVHRAVFKNADAVQAISRFLADWAVRMGFRGKPAVIPNGVDVKRFAVPIADEERRNIRQSWGVEDGEKVIITTSRLSLKNGVDDIIRAMERLPSQWKCVIVGDGEDAATLRALVQDMGLGDRVIFLGRRPHDELPALLHASDVFVRPSLSEGLGNSFLEAMATGLPIVGTPIGGIPDFLLDGQTGLFCKVRNPESIAAAVLRFEDAGLRSRVIQNGRALVEQKYGWDDIARRMNELLLSICR